MKVGGVFQYDLKELQYDCDKRYSHIEREMGDKVHSVSARSGKCRRQLLVLMAPACVTSLRRWHVSHSAAANLIFLTSSKLLMLVSQCI